MSVSVDFADATVKRLQKLDLAVPFEDTIETVVNKLADFYEQAPSRQPSQPPKASPAPQPVHGPRDFNGASPPNLTHTKVLSVKVGGASMRGASWSSLLYEMVRRAKGRLNTRDEQSRLMLVNFTTGKKEDEGYRYIPEAGISVQGQNANYAWKGASHLAKQLGISIEVEFLWRAGKKAAAHPGVTGRMSA